MVTRNRIFSRDVKFEELRVSLDANNRRLLNLKTEMEYQRPDAEDGIVELEMLLIEKKNPEQSHRSEKVIPF